MGLVHSDIKGKNILVDHYGVARIADFGVAVVFEHTGIASGTGGGGTKEYQAPELRNGTVQRSTRRSDIYALGTVIWEVNKSSSNLRTNGC
jgi:serine/threonine protein kinase